MIVRTRAGGDMQIRSAPEFGSSAIPFPGGGFAGYSGKSVTLDRAAGLPAVMAAIRLVCGTVAMCDLDVYQQADDAGPPRPTEGSWQEQLFDNPSMDDSEFDFLSDLAAGVEGYGNSFFLKTKAKGRVLELRPLPPDYVRIRRDRGQKVFDVTFPSATGSPGRIVRGVTTADILHIPGFRWPGLLSGLSPIQMHRAALDRSLALEEFAGRFFANDASVSFALKVPGKVTRDQAREMLDIWEATHGGLQNAHRPGILSNGADAVRLGLSLRDSQFIEASAYTTTQVAQIWGVPADLIEGGDTATTERLSVEQLGLRLLTFSMAPRLRRIEKAIAADPDLFPPGSGLAPRFTTKELIRLDASTQANVLHQQIQDGTLNRNEARFELGRGPVPGGEVYLDTPVGGAPNDPPPADPTGTLEQPGGARERVILLPITGPADSRISPELLDAIAEHTAAVVALAARELPAPTVENNITVKPAQVHADLHLAQAPAKPRRATAHRAANGDLEVTYQEDE